MKRTMTLLLAAACVLATAPATRADTAKDMANVAAKTQNALAMLSCKVETAIPGQKRELRELAICVNKQGLFMTLAFDARTQVKSLSEFELILPGPSGKSVKAKLLGVDPSTGISFIQATEPHTWQAISFASSAAPSPGQQVFSVGLMGGDGGRTPYFGTGYVSATFRVPGHLIYVTGGKLTGVGSPVLLGDGRAVGIVGRQQLPLAYNTVVGRRRGSVRLIGRQETSFFLPVDEFIHVLRQPPTGNAARRLPWMGVIGYKPVDKEYAELIKLDRPGVQLDKVVPGQPADKAGLKSRDVIIAADGKPLEKLATPALVASNFVRNLARRKPGDSIRLTVLRATKPQEFTVRLAPMPKQPYEADLYVQPRLGFIAREKVEMDRYADPNPTATVDGVVVVAVGRQTAALAGGLKGGDLITSVNDQKVSGLTKFKQIVDGAVANQPNRALNLVIQRGAQTQAISLQVPPKRGR